MYGKKATMVPCAGCGAEIGEYCFLTIETGFLWWKRIEKLYGEAPCICRVRMAEQEHKHVYSSEIAHCYVPTVRQMFKPTAPKMVLFCECGHSRAFSA